MKKDKTLLVIILAIMIEIIFFSIEKRISGNIKNVTIAIIVALSFISILVSKKVFKTNYQHLIFLTMAIGLIIRLMYIIYSPIEVRQHDLGSINDPGHLGYIYTIYETGKLPDSNAIEYYHPPLFHIIGAISLKTTTSLGSSLEESIEALQYVTCFISFLIMIVIFKIVERLKIEDSLKLLINIFLIFHPHFILLSGCVNNDILLILFQLLIILYLLKWYENPNWKNTIILALVTGLCVMTKISGAIMAIPILFVFIKKLCFGKSIKEIFNNKLIFNIVVFGLISLPIGLWFPIRNYVLFKQPLTYVVAPIEILSTRQYNFFERFFTFPLYEIGGIFCNPWRDYSVPVYLIKSSLFGDALSEHITIINVWLLLEALILSTISFIILIKYVKKKKKDMISMLFLVSFFTIIGSYIYFNLKMPYGCTMDFRYIVPVALFSITFVAEYLSMTKHLFLKKFIIYTCYLFTILSITMFFTL